MHRRYGQQPDSGPWYECFCDTGPGGDSGVPGAVCGCPVPVPAVAAATAAAPSGRRSDDSAREPPHCPAGQPQRLPQSPAWKRRCLRGHCRTPLREASPISWKQLPPSGRHHISRSPGEPLLPSHKVTRPATAPTGSSEQGLQRDLSACREQFSSPRPLDAVPPVSPGGVSPTSMFRQGSLSSQPDLLAVTRGGDAPPHTWANTLPRGRPDVLGPSFAIEHVETPPLPWDMHNGTLSTLRGKGAELPPDSVQVRHHSVVSAQPTGWEQTWL